MWRQSQNVYVNKFLLGLLDKYGNNFEKLFSYLEFLYQINNMPAESALY